MAQFIKGMALSQAFFHEAAQPILQACFPTLNYSAGLLGYGSDVLGYDDPVSTDHMWGPRFYLFLSPEDMKWKEAVYQALSNHLPLTFRGYSVNFSLPDPNDGGVRHPEFINSGPVSPLIFIGTFAAFLEEYLGIDHLTGLSCNQWLSFSEHRLLALAQGSFFADGLGLAGQLAAVRYYPPPVQRYLIASQWALIGEEQAFVKRCGAVGDTLGSRLACGRICERLMRLCFLYCRRYAPYSKWFGTAFGSLPIDPALTQALHQALETEDLIKREQALAQGQLLTARLHNQCGATPFIHAEIQPYFSRDILVVYADRIAAAVAKSLAGTGLERLPLMGSLSQVGNYCCIADNPQYHPQIDLFYQSFQH